MIRYLSLFDGIGAVHVAWQPLGWQCVGTAEWESFPAADGPRYKAIGNSMAVPVMRWIGERIASTVSEQEVAA
jgi:site-specific DNA-cytosine methylase